MLCDVAFFFWPGCNMLKRVVALCFRPLLPFCRKCAAWQTCMVETGWNLSYCEICFPWFLRIPDIFNLLPSWSAMIPHCRNLENITNIDFSRCTGEPLNSFIDLAFVAFRKGGGDSDWGNDDSCARWGKVSHNNNAQCSNFDRLNVVPFEVPWRIKESLRCNTVRR